MLVSPETLRRRIDFLTQLDPVKYAGAIAESQQILEDGEGTQWITIGGSAEERPGGEKVKHAGGFPVQIDGHGKILKGGPEHLHGVAVKDVHSHFQGHRNGNGHAEHGKQDEPAKPSQAPKAMWQKSHGELTAEMEKEHDARKLGPLARAKDRLNRVANHEKSIEDAIHAGHEVPEHVLADYPHLRPKNKPAVKVAPEPPAAVAKPAPAAPPARPLTKSQATKAAMDKLTPADVLKIPELAGSFQKLADKKLHSIDNAEEYQQLVMGFLNHFGNEPGHGLKTLKRLASDHRLGEFTPQPVKPLTPEQAEFNRHMVASLDAEDVRQWKRERERVATLRPDLLDREYGIMGGDVEQKRQQVLDALDARIARNQQRDMQSLAIPTAKITYGGGQRELTRRNGWWHVKDQQGNWCAVRSDLHNRVEESYVKTHGGDDGQAQAAAGQPAAGSVAGSGGDRVDGQQPLLGTRGLLAESQPGQAGGDVREGSGRGTWARQAGRRPFVLPWERAGNRAGTSGVDGRVAEGTTPAGPGRGDGGGRPVLEVGAESTGRGRLRDPGDPDQDLAGDRGTHGLAAGSVGADRDAGRAELPVVLEGLAGKREFSNTLIKITGAVADQILAMGQEIADEDLAEKGREAEPHVSIRFGLHDDTPEAVANLLSGHGPVSFTLGKTSAFPASDAKPYDVIKIDVNSPDLQELNDKLGALPNTSDFAYSPHITLAYVKPGLAYKYTGRDDVDGYEVVADEACFSDKSRKQTPIPLASDDDAADGDDWEQDVCGMACDILGCGPDHGDLELASMDAVDELLDEPYNFDDAVENVIEKLAKFSANDLDDEQARAVDELWHEVRERSDRRVAESKFAKGQRSFDWDETKVVRDHGKFAEKGAGASADHQSESPKHELSKLADDELKDHHSRLETQVNTAKQHLEEYPEDDEIHQAAKARLESLSPKLDEAKQETERRGGGEVKVELPRKEVDLSDLGGGTIVKGRSGERGATFGDLKRSKHQVEFPNPIVGPSGAKLTGYDWKWMMFEDVDDRGEERRRRISDWDEAVGSDDTGRDIVHHFSVVTPTGDHQTVSLESALKVLGYMPKDKLAPGVANIKTLASALKRRAMGQMEIDRREDLVKRIDGALAEVNQKVQGEPRPEIVLGETPVRRTNDAIDRGDPATKPQWTMGDVSCTAWGDDQMRDAKAGRIPDEVRENLEDHWRQKRVKEHFPEALAAEYESLESHKFTPEYWDKYTRKSFQNDIQKRKERLADTEKHIKALSEEAAEAAGTGGPRKHRDILRDVIDATDAFWTDTKGTKWNDLHSAVASSLEAKGVRRDEISDAIDELRPVFTKLAKLTGRSWYGHHSRSKDVMRADEAPEIPADERYRTRALPAIPATTDRKITKWYLDRRDEIKQALQDAQDWRRKWLPEN